VKSAKQRKEEVLNLIGEPTIIRIQKRLNNNKEARKQNRIIGTQQ